MDLCDSDEDDAERMELCDSDEDDAPAQQPARAAGSSKPAAQTVAQTSGQASEAKRRKAVVPAPLPAKQAKQMQCPETRQLGIRDPPPPKLSGSNALLSSLAKGANRVSSLLHKSHTMSGSMSHRHLVAAVSPASHFSYHAVHLAQLNTRSA